MLVGSRAFDMDLQTIWAKIIFWFNQTTIRLKKTHPLYKKVYSA